MRTISVHESRTATKVCFKLNKEIILRINILYDSQDPTWIMISARTSYFPYFLPSVQYFNLFLIILNTNQTSCCSTKVMYLTYKVFCFGTKARNVLTTNLNCFSGI